MRARRRYISDMNGWVRVTVFLSDAGCLFMPGTLFVDCGGFKVLGMRLDCRCKVQPYVVHITGPCIPLLFTDTRANLPYS